MNGHAKWCGIVERGEYDKIIDLGIDDFLNAVKTKINEG